MDQGSYHDYYSKRNNEGLSRLDLINPQLLANKVILDVGCNSGYLTNIVAQRFRAKSVLGIDCDRTLIDAANSIIKRAKYELKLPSDHEASLQVPTQSKSSTVKNSSFFKPRSVVLSSSTAQSTLTIKNDSETSSESSISSSSHISDTQYPHNISFQCTDIFSDMLRNTSFDTILCLSVTKWVHLNTGDEGLMKLFNVLYQLCRPGGSVVLEYQPWRSYVNKKSLTTAIKQIFPTIQIKPEMFEQCLLDIGFVIDSRLGPSLEDAKGYSRPILVLLRPLTQTTTVTDMILDNDSSVVKPTVPVYSSSDTASSSSHFIDALHQPRLRIKLTPSHTASSSSSLSTSTTVDTHTVSENTQEKCVAAMLKAMSVSPPPDPGPDRAEAPITIPIAASSTSHSKAHKGVKRNHKSDNSSIISKVINADSSSNSEGVYGESEHDIKRTKHIYFDD